MIFLALLIGMPGFLLCLVFLFGAPKAPSPLKSIVEPFQGLDYSDLPPLSLFPARDGSSLAYRHYPNGAGKGSLVLLHGSASSSIGMHPLARALAHAGWAVFALDVRGHGESGTRGKIDYIGQLEDDLEDFLLEINPTRKTILMGFSSGGGFALRFASGSKRSLFDGTLLLAPFLHQDSPTGRQGSGGWIGLSLPRLIALTILNRFGVTRFNGLSVAAFALPERARTTLTQEYSFSLLSNYRPREDYRADIRNVERPMEVLAGQDDEILQTDHYAGEFTRDKGNIPVKRVPGLGHVALILDKRGQEAIIVTLNSLRKKL